MLTTTFIYILIEMIALIIITLFVLSKIKKTDNKYIASMRSPKLAFPNKQVKDVMKYIYIGNVKFELNLTSDNKLDF